MRDRYAPANTQLTSIRRNAVPARAPGSRKLAGTYGQCRCYRGDVPSTLLRSAAGPATAQPGTRGWAACLAGIPGRQPGVPQQLVAWRLAQSGGQLSGLLEGTAVLQTLAQADADELFLGSVGQLAMDG